MGAKLIFQPSIEGSHSQKLPPSNQESNLMWISLHRIEDFGTLGECETRWRPWIRTRSDRIRSPALGRQHVRVIVSFCTGVAGDLDVFCTREGRGGNPPPLRARLHGFWRSRIDVGWTSENLLNFRSELIRHEH
ncbi:MAG: hypothetical protein CL912_06985 [Deltaproteobacteria bacterium]|nr:hypothetical protein [Deltaproteobacteria bacterium]